MLRAMLVSIRNSTTISRRKSRELKNLLMSARDKLLKSAPQEYRNGDLNHVSSAIVILDTIFQKHPKYKGDMTSDYFRVYDKNICEGKTVVPLAPTVVYLKDKPLLNDLPILCRDFFNATSWEINSTKYYYNYSQEVHLIIDRAPSEYLFISCSDLDFRSAKKIKIHYKSIIERSGQIVLVEKIIKTRYFSPITWVNFVVNSSIINYLVEKKKKEIENLVSKNDFNPSSFSSFPSFNKKIKNIPNINADHLILIGFYYDDFKCTDSFSLGGLYMFIDNLEYSWRLKDQTIFLIALFPAKTQINNILKQLPLIQDLDKLKNGLFLGGKKIQAVVSCFVGDTRESFPAKGRLQPGALNSCSICKAKLGDLNYSNPNFQHEKRDKNETKMIQKKDDRILQ
ncbi:hypothetical protein M0813_19511 [Anaeramoeba flamelloides]|uniref:Uncharacterized protein n=1 Tax=Anaeramoeba flamelloides TaxID=1746091 RepID=A0ABQ8YP48_9EUKA|nr:hypothetical protein M0813_19511 [Anaeramoeba flamelloides]